MGALTVGDTTRKGMRISVVGNILILLGCSGSATTGDELIDTSDASATRDALGDHAVQDSNIQSEQDVQQDAVCENKCSADSRKVIDCHDNVVQTCSSDKACFEAACQDPCTIAAATHIGGCEFYLTNPVTIAVRKGQCFVMGLTNISGADVTLSGDYQDEVLDMSTAAVIPQGNSKNLSYDPITNNKLPAGKTALVFLSAFGTDNGSQCPAGTFPAINDRYTDFADSLITDAFHIQTTGPVIAFANYAYNNAYFTTGLAEYIYPVTEWGTNYIAQTPYPKSEVLAGFSQNFIQIVAKEDNTTIQIKPSADIVGNGDNGVAGASQGTVKSYSLNKGKVLQLMQDAELVGSILISNKAVGLWGGSSFLSVEPDQGSGDSVHQQVLPIGKIGHEYVAVEPYNRVSSIAENAPWRMVGVVAGTTLTYEPKRPQNAPTMLGAEQVVSFSFNYNSNDPTSEQPFPFTVHSQDSAHPFYFWGYMTGGTNAGNIGDPEWESVPSPEQYMKSTSLMADPSDSYVLIRVVRRKVDGAFKDVTLDCQGGVLSGWTTVGTAGDYQYTDAPLVLDGTPQGDCGFGVLHLTSDNPFTATMWEWTKNFFSLSYTPRSTPDQNQVSVPAN